MVRDLAVDIDVDPAAQLPFALQLAVPRHLRFAGKDVIEHDVLRNGIQE